MINYVYNKAGAMIDFDAAVYLMDDEIREDLHNNLAPCTDQDFFTVYEQAHAEKFGEDWELSSDNPQY